MHVTRLYGSTDPSQPRIFHGNTCAHEMNIVSTAYKLPRTPDDINGMLSVVFVGPGNFNRNCLTNIFKIHKSKVWKFLLWLKANNILYKDIEIDSHAMDLYPDNDIVPGLLENVIEDNVLDPSTTFDEETAGLTDHPARLMCNNNDSSTETTTLLEKTGVSDPEGVRISGRTFTATALRNILPKNAKLPDLVLHCSSSAICEYNNPDLLPGMFPTLFPLGIGGFDNVHCLPKISFHKQAQYYLDTR